MKKSTLPAALIFLVILASSCKDEQIYGLKDAFAGDFLIGTAVNAPQILVLTRRQNHSSLNISMQSLLKMGMKWEWIPAHHPETYDFAMADTMVTFALENSMFITGHILVWHSQTPDWVFRDSLGNALTRDALLARMKVHIFTVVGHFKGRVQGWDVVNEAVGDDGQIRRSKWYEIIGEDYIEKAFEYAHEADPDAELYYNDYNNEQPSNGQGSYRLLGICGRIEPQG